MVTTDDPKLAETLAALSRNHGNLERCSPAGRGAGANGTTRMVLLGFKLSTAGNCLCAGKSSSYKQTWCEIWERRARNRSDFTRRPFREIPGRDFHPPCGPDANPAWHFVSKSGLISRG